MQPPKPIDVVHLFPKLLDSLLDLLHELSDAEWHRLTACAPWTVKDVAVHLWGGDVGILSRGRDGYATSFIESASWDQLVDAINRQNALWVEAMQRISPPLLCDYMRPTGEQVCRHFATLDPNATGNPVDWAGAGGAPIWLDLAREYTERWHHQQHIRDAVDRPGLKETKFLAPVLDTFVRALPHAYHDVVGAEGCTLLLHITGDAGNRWTLRREHAAWRLYVGAAEQPAATVALDQELAWRLFTNGLDVSRERHRITITGDERLTEPLLRAVAIIA